MAITEKSYFYEMLIRGDKSGVTGAHVKYITEVSDDETGRVYAANEGEAIPIDTKSDISLPSSDVIDKIDMIALSTINQQSEIIRGKDDEISGSKMLLSDKDDQIETQGQEIQSLEASVNQSREKIAELQKEIDSLKLTIDNLNSASEGILDEILL